MIDDTPCLRLALFQDLTLYVLIDLRTGKLVLRDAGDLAAWERGYRFAQYARTLNETPQRVLDVIQLLRFNVGRVQLNPPIQRRAHIAGHLEHCGGSRAAS